LRSSTSAWASAASALAFWAGSRLEIFVSAVCFAAVAAVTPAEIPTEVIALRAYYISEARQAAGIPGDSTLDWLEAERQVRAEL